MNTLKALISLLMLALLVAACGQQGGPMSASAEVNMSVRAEPEPLAVGETTLIITLKDAVGSPIDNAILQVHGDMDHEGMTPVDREVRESVDGVYRVPFAWTMGGGWIVTVTAELPDNGGEIANTFDFFVEAVSSESVINRQNHIEMDAEATDETSMNMSDSAAVNVTYQSDNDPARGGDATVTITLTDHDGSPITDASVELIGDMAHEGMMPISGVGEYAGDGQYVVSLRWTMAGDWFVTVAVTLADGRQLERVFDQEVVVP